MKLRVGTTIASVAMLLSASVTAEHARSETAIISTPAQVHAPSARATVQDVARLYKGLTEFPPPKVVAALGFLDEFQSLFKEAQGAKTAMEREAIVLRASNLGFILGLSTAVSSIPGESRVTLDGTISALVTVVSALEEGVDAQVRDFAIYQLLLAKCIGLGPDTCDLGKLNVLHAKIMAWHPEAPMLDLIRRYALFVGQRNGLQGEPRTYNYDVLREGRQVTRDAANCREYPFEMAFFDHLIDVEYSRREVANISSNDLAPGAAESVRKKHLDNIDQLSRLDYSTASSYFRNLKTIVDQREQLGEKGMQAGM